MTGSISFYKYRKPISYRFLKVVSFSNCGNPLKCSDYLNQTANTSSIGLVLTHYTWYFNVTLGLNRLALANRHFVLDRSHYICWRSSVASIALRPPTNSSAQPAYKLDRANGRVESVNGVFSFLVSLAPLTTAYKVCPKCPKPTRERAFII